MGSGTDFARRVHEAIRSIPAGRVSTYGRVAEMAGHPGAGRAVGSVLAALDEDTDVAWWRVVGSGGRITTSRARHTAQLQRALLEEEGVEFDERGRIAWSRFGWESGAEDL